MMNIVYIMKVILPAWDVHTGTSISYSNLTSGVQHCVAMRLGDVGNRCGDGCEINFEHNGVIALGAESDLYSLKAVSQTRPIPHSITMEIKMVSMEMP